MTRSEVLRVLIVHPSAVARAALAHALRPARNIVVLPGAHTFPQARTLILQEHPDVILLDLELAQADKLVFLKTLMKHYPVAVLMCGNVNAQTSPTAIRAVELGAVDVIATSAGGPAAPGISEPLAEKIRAAAKAFLHSSPNRESVASSVPSFRAAGLDPDRYVIVIGASTGGTEAIRSVLTHVPADFPPVAIVQHMPAGFTRSFAARLDQFSPMTVREAAGGEKLESGQAWLARGNIQMHLRATGGRWYLEYGSDEPVNLHCPSVDVLFHSAARWVGPQTVGVLLTGMGADGARGLLRLRQRGAVTIGQDERSCVVYGMPKAAAELGAVEHCCSPAQVGQVIMQALQARERAAVFRP